MSTALGVHPDQVPEEMERLKRIGVPTEFNKDGDAILTDRRHNAKLARACGYFNRDGGYGDASPGDPIPGE